MKDNKINGLLKVLFVIISVALVIPSIIYIIKYKTVFGFNTYYNFFIIDKTNKTLSTIIYLVAFILLSIIYLNFIKRKNIFTNIKSLLIYVGIISSIFLFMLPWTSSDIFYYMGVGEINSQYNQNPYYVSMSEYVQENSESVNDEILKQGSIGVWAKTTVVYGPISQIIFSTLTKISFKNIDFCLFLFKLLNIIIHILNCYLIYKLTKKLKFSIIYGLNPFIFLEFIGNVHNDIFLMFFVLLAFYYVLKRRNIIASIFLLAIATGIKYFSVLLLPVIVIYYIKEEGSILKRFLLCIKYGILFFIFFILEYFIFFKDMTIFTAMMAQTSKYCKSIYSSLFVAGIISTENIIVLSKYVLYGFIYGYILFCINLITTKKIKFAEFIRKYNIFAIWFLLCLTSFQQWYIMWLFIGMFWLKPKMIKSIIALSLISELANSVYMFKTENWHYDIYFVGIIIISFIIWKEIQIIKEKSLKNKLKRGMKIE